MNDLVVKEVGFFGTGLLAVHEQTSGRIYAGINPILQNLGFDEKQIEYRRDKWVSDKSIGKGTLKFSGTLLGMKTGRDVWCIDIKKLPLALAKLEVTPKIEKEMPELATKLEIYQDKCADVLAAAFSPEKEAFKKISATEQLRLQQQAILEVDEKIDAVDADLQEFKRDMPLLALECQKITRAKNQRVVPFMGGKNAPAYKNNKLRSRVYRDLEGQLNREFGVDTYKAIKRNQCELAIQIIKDYELPMALEEEIRDINAQVDMLWEAGH